jgi:phenylalanyl-tRNA synthetase beta chain
MLRGAEYLRRSLVPSLLGVRRLNESLSNDVIELFETAKVYLPHPGQMPAEPLMLGITSGQGFFYVKGIIEKLLNVVDPQLELDCSDFHDPLFASGQACRLGVAKRELGVLGTLSAEGCLQFDLRGPTTVAELRIEPFCELANLIPQYTPHSAHPAIVRDLNLIVSESLRWAELSATVRSASDEALESIDYRETYRDPERDGVGKKRLLFSMTFRKPQRTLTGDEADAICQAIVAECHAKHAAELLT